MSRVFVTGDTHGSLDIRKLNLKNFPEQTNLTKKDYVIICGDFGLVWQGSKEEKWWLNWLNNKPFTTLFIDGNHENFDRLRSYSVSNWKGGAVHFIKDTVIHLMRGQVFTFAGMKFFTMGGGTSIDKQFRVEGRTWWPQEVPNTRELIEGFKNLDEHNWKVDVVLTHTTSRRMMNQMGYVKEQSDLNTYFDILEKDLSYHKWFFGHFHHDIVFDKKHYLLYREIVEII